jgi:hypothetical protein
LARALPGAEQNQHSPAHSYSLCVLQVRATNRCQGQLHNRTSSSHPLLPLEVDGTLAQNSEAGHMGCTARYQGRLQAEARSRHADHVADERHHWHRQQQQDALLRVKDSLGICNQLSEQYPHGLPRGMIRRLKLEGNISETPGQLGFGQS